MDACSCPVNPDVIRLQKVLGIVKPNPYESPHVDCLGAMTAESEISPASLVDFTRTMVSRFGWFQFASPFLVAYWTDTLFIDLWALFIATNGMRVNKTSFRRFPWTALMCAVYPLVFVVCITGSSPMSLNDWIPSRFSPVLSLQLASAIWAALAIVCIIKCHQSHRSQQPQGDEGNHSRS